MKRSNVFVVGTPFSGATLLSQMLGAHPGVFNAGDVAHVLGARGMHSACGACDSAGHACAVWEHPAVAAACEKGPSGLYDALARATACDTILDASKTPRWLAARINDEAANGRPTHIILCTSDPLLAVRAQGAMTGESATTCAELWHDQNAALLQGAFASGCPVLNVRFDDLAAQTDETLRRVCDFLGLEYSPALAAWFEAPAHTVGLHAESAWDGELLSARSAAGTAAHTEAAFAWIGVDGTDERPALHFADVIDVQQLLAASPVAGLLNYAIELPTYDANESPEARERTLAWVRTKLDEAREAMLEERAPQAFEVLLFLFNHFGTSFDSLGFELTYESLATVLTDMLTQAGQYEEALAVTTEVITNHPDSADATRMHATALLRMGKSATARELVQNVLARCPPDMVGDAQLPDVIEQVLVQTHPDDPAMAIFLTALARHPRIAACVDAALEATPAAQRTPGAWAALGLVRATRGELTSAASVLEEGLTYHSRSVIVANALFAVHAKQHPDDPRYQLKGRFCAKPFENIELLPGGPAHMCCAVWMPDAIGNVYNAAKWEDVWNSPTAQDMRASILDGSYRWCNKISCPVIQNADLQQFVQITDPRWQEVVEKNMTVLPYAPATVNLSYDKSCNLACPSCRTHTIMSNDADRIKIDAMTDRVVLPLLKDCELVTVTGSGDPFASRTFRRLLQQLGELDYPKLKYHLLTNGQLLTPEVWEQFPKLKERTKSLAVSLDAATEEVYRIVRRPGHIEKVIPNLHYMKTLVDRGELECFGLRFVVQVDNYREMPAFVRLAKEVGANDVMFQRLINWDTFTQEEFAKRAVFHEDHPLYEDFLRVMQDPILQDPMVDLGMLKAFVQDNTNAPNTKAAAA
jgi:sulfatase maturation enzyme AslB (radical SAM superfamily)/tetratricopeptide (TPR) repeat protein